CLGGVGGFFWLFLLGFVLGGFVGWWFLLLWVVFVCVFRFLLFGVRSATSLVWREAASLGVLLS
ncbi:hypothetical protein, partial [Neisseria sp. P0013.S004]|uniref:hypothetical protein n=1 Tax=Neisseria sp. P0013.S004 TaxID=3436740 RepID=UPI003F7EDF0E